MMDKEKQFLNFDEPFGNNFPLSAKNASKTNANSPAPVELLRKVPSQHYMSSFYQDQNST